jgi:hypothetical protein
MHNREYDRSAIGLERGSAQVATVWELTLQL